MKSEYVNKSLMRGSHQCYIITTLPIIVFLKRFRPRSKVIVFPI